MSGHGWNARAWVAVAASALMSIGPGCGDDGAQADGEDTTGSVDGTAGTTTTTDTTAGTSTTTEGTTTDVADTTESGSTGDPCECVPPDCPEQCLDPLEAEIGFVEIEPVTFTLHQGAQSQGFTSSAARLWYGFQPADTDPHDKPIAVLFNGGPGASSEILFAFNTSARSFDEDHNGGGAIGPSPSSWTAFANVLYVDARITGFSYNLMDDPSNQSARFQEFGIQNFNSWLDAADFVRVVLRFLADHPDLRGNEVVLVGESYGGVRATAMLDLLLAYESHGDGTAVYEDDALASEIQAHFDAIFPQMAGQSFAPETIAQQFSRQLLVQPLILGDQQFDVAGQQFDQQGSVIFDIAADTNTTFVPCSQQGGGCDPFYNAINYVENIAGRDRFAYAMPYDWLFERIDSIAPKFATVDLAAEMFGADPAGVTKLYADERTGAYRTNSFFSLVDPTPDSFLWQPKHHELLLPSRDFAAGGALHDDGDYPGTFGDLQPWDTYYLSSNYIVLDTFYSGAAYNWGIDPYSDLLATSFLRNVAYVDTFITNASWDLVIWGPAIPPTMDLFSMYVTNVVHDETEPADADRPGQIVVDYQDGAFGLGSGESRTIRFPYYDQASHTVPLSQPEELSADFVDWLSG